MSLRDQIEKNKQPDTDACTLAVIMRSIDGDDKEALLEALSSDLPTVTIRRALRSEGFHIGEPTINDHRKGRCKCIIKK